MVRRDAVDFGLWPGIPTDRLIVPTDTHVHRIARRLRLTRRKTADWKAAREITRSLSRFDPARSRPLRLRALPDRHPRHLPPSPVAIPVRRLPRAGSLLDRPAPGAAIRAAPTASRDSRRDDALAPDRDLRRRPRGGRHGLDQVPRASRVAHGVAAVPVRGARACRSSTAPARRPTCRRRRESSSSSISGRPGARRASRRSRPSRRSGTSTASAATSSSSRSRSTRTGRRSTTS